MVKVKYHNNYLFITQNLTNGKVYDVIDYGRKDNRDYIFIIDDNGNKASFYTANILGELFFENVTEEYRDEIIDEILN